MRKLSPHTVGRTVPGAPPSDDRRRRFYAPTSPHPVGAGFHARTALGRLATLVRRTYLAPTPQSRRYAPRQLPFQGSRGPGGGFHLYASVYHDAATSVSLLPVRGGVLDAPRWCDRRAALDAYVWPDRFCPRFPRCARLASAAPRIQIPRAQPAHHFYGRPRLSVDRGRAGVEARPYGVSEGGCAKYNVARRPAQG